MAPADTKESQPKEFAEDSLAINDLHCFTSSSSNSLALYYYFSRYGKFPGILGSFWRNIGASWVGDGKAACPKL